MNGLTQMPQVDEPESAGDLTPNREGFELATGFSAIIAKPQLYISSPDSRGIGDLISFVLLFCFETPSNGGGGAHAARVSILPNGSIRITSDGAGLPTNTDASTTDSMVPLFAQMRVGRHWAGESLYIVNAFSRQLNAKTVVAEHWVQQNFTSDTFWTPLAEIDRPVGSITTEIEFWPRTDIFGANFGIIGILAKLDDFQVSLPDASLIFEDTRTAPSVLRTWGS
jgi:DNA gyrase/topoisomerase IV subunit B